MSIKGSYLLTATCDKCGVKQDIRGQGRGDCLRALFLDYGWYSTLSADNVHYCKNCK